MNDVTNFNKGKTAGLRNYLTKKLKSSLKLFLLIAPKFPL